MDTSQFIALAGAITGVVGLAVSVFTALSSVRRGAFQNLSEDYKRIDLENTRLRERVQCLEEQVLVLQQTITEYERGFSVWELQAIKNGELPAWKPGEDPEEARKKLLESMGGLGVEVPQTW